MLQPRFEFVSWSYLKQKYGDEVDNNTLGILYNVVNAELENNQYDDDIIVGQKKLDKIIDAIHTAQSALEDVLYEARG